MLSIIQVLNRLAYVMRLLWKSGATCSRVLYISLLTDSLDFVLFVLKKRVCFCFACVAYRYMGEEDTSDEEDGMDEEEMGDEEDDEEPDVKPPSKRKKEDQAPAKGSPAKRGGKK